MVTRGTKKDWVTLSIRLPQTVVDALDKKVDENATNRQIEAAKMIVFGLQEKKYLDKGKLYLSDGKDNVTSK